MMMQRGKPYTQTLPLVFDRLAYTAILSVLTCIPFTKGGIEVSISIAAGAWFICVLIQRKFDFRNSLLFLPLCFYLGAVVLSMGNTPLIDASLQGLLRAVKYFTLYLVASQVIRTENRFRWLIRALVLVAFLSCLNALHQWLTGWDFRHKFSILYIDGIQRLTGSFHHPNNFAAFLVTTISILWFAKDNLPIRLLSFATCFFCLWVLMGTYSRAPVILFGVILLGFSLFSNYHRGQLVLILGGIFLFLLWYSMHHVDYLPRLLMAGRRDARLDYWIVSLDSVKYHPIFGSGVNTFMHVFGQNPKINHYGATRFVYAHNFVLQMLVEIGIMGLLAFLAVLRLFFSHAWRYIQNAREPFKSNAYGIVVAISFFLLHSLVDNNLQSLQLTTFFWVVVGSLMGLIAHTAPSVASYKKLK